MKIKIVIASLLVFIMMSSSCATILGGSKKGIKVTGEPANAKVYYNGDFIGNVPVKVKVPKNAKQGNSTITIEAENYQTSSVQLSRKWSFGYTVLDIMTGVVPLIIDVATQNIYQPKPARIKYNLTLNTGIVNKFKTGDIVIITSKKHKNQKAEIIDILGDGVKIRFTRKTNAIEKLTKKADEITEEIEINYSEIRKFN